MIELQQVLVALRLGDYSRGLELLERYYDNACNTIKKLEALNEEPEVSVNCTKCHGTGVVDMTYCCSCLVRGTLENKSLQTQHRGISYENDK